MGRMRKGEATRREILQHATGLASRVGLEGLTIGRLADDLELSKSGLFAHFRSKEALQAQVIEHAAARFIATVVRTGVGERHFNPSVEPAQVAQELYGIMLGWHHATRLLRDPKAEARARAAFEALLARIGR